MLYQKNAGLIANRRNVFTDPAKHFAVKLAIRKVATARIPSTFSFRGTGILSLRQVSRVFGFCHVDLLSILTMINS
jgi:hypothetical protein